MGSSDTTPLPTPLSPAHAAIITASAIAPEVAAARGYRTVTVKAELARLGFSRPQQLVPALLVPVWGVADASEPVTHQIRPDAPRRSKGKALKYETPAGSRMALDVPRVPVVRDYLGDPARPLWITEGARKADAAASRGLCCLALLGVWNWRGSNEHGGKGVLPDWDSIALNGRQVYVVFDSDVMIKEGVRLALERLRGFLESRGALVRLVYLPAGPGGTKVGLDDFLAADPARGADALIALSSDTTRAPAEAGPLFAAPTYASNTSSTTGGASPTSAASSAAATTAPTADEIRETDTGNARRMFALFGQDLRYCRAWKSWLWWDGARWKFDETDRIYRYATRTVAQIFRDAVACADLETRDRMLAHARRSEGEPRLRAMVTLASKHHEIAAVPDEFDSDPWIFAASNGMIDLREGVLVPHDRAKKITKISRIPFDPTARCPTWEAFLLSVMDGRQELVDFLQRAIGYSLTGSTREHVLFFCYGTGSNGKSVFLETLESLLGDFAKHADMASFVGERGRSVRSDLARLAGARLVTASELDNGAPLAEGLVKSLTGADKITASFLYADEFEYRPQFKLWLAGNHKPRIKGRDEGIWRRIRLVPFDRQFRDPQPDIPVDMRKDKELGRKLQAELPGILAWSVRGCRVWLNEGLKEPSAVIQATAEYRAEQDILGQFLTENVFFNSCATVGSTELYRRYETWAKDSGERPVAQRTLGIYLGESGFERGKDGSGYNYWIGMGLIPTQDISPRTIRSIGGSSPETPHPPAHIYDSRQVAPNPPYPPEPAPRAAFLSEAHPPSSSVILRAQANTVDL